MKVIFRKYEPAKDFMHVRDMLVETYRAFEKPINWTLVRWEYARHFCAPMLGAYGLGETSDGSLEMEFGIWGQTSNFEISLASSPLSFLSSDNNFSIFSPALLTAECLMPNSAPIS